MSSCDVIYGAWKAQIAQFVSPHFVGKSQTSCRYPRRKAWPQGCWIRSISNASVLLSKKDSCPPILSLILNGNVQEHHYVSSLAFAWPQTARGSRIIFLASYNSLNEKQKFAMRFDSDLEAKACFKTLQGTTTENQQSNVVYPSSTCIEPAPLCTRTPESKTAAKKHVFGGLRRDCTRKSSKCGSSHHYKRKRTATSACDSFSVHAGFKKTSTIKSFNLQSYVQPFLSSLDPKSNMSDHVISSPSSPGNMGILRPNSPVASYDLEIPTNDPSKENTETLLLVSKSYAKRHTITDTNFKEGRDNGQDLPTSSFCKNSSLDWPPCFASIIKQTNQTEADACEDSGFIAQLPPRFSSYLPSEKSICENESKSGQGNPILCLEGMKEENTCAEVLSPDSLELFSGITSTLHILGGDSSDNPGLKQQIMACFLDPSFQALVNEVERVWLELERSMADDIKALRSFLGDV